MDYNTIIIGSGVAGMTAALYLSRANISVCIIEKDTPGGQITRTSTIDNYPGISSIEGPDLALSFFNQINKFNVPYIYDECIEIECSSDKKIVKTKNKTLMCKNIIIATGRSPRKLNVPNEEKLIGNGISYCAICDGGLYKDKNIAVIGGGTAALEETLYLSKICSEVTLIHRRDEFRADSSLIESVKSVQNVKILTDKIVEKFNDENGKLKSIDIRNKQDEIETINVDGCFEYVGQEPNTKNLEALNILDKEGYVKVNDNFETNIKGIYAIGDCIKKELYQIVTACSDGAQVANTIVKQI